MPLFHTPSAPAARPRSAAPGYLKAARAQLGRLAIAAGPCPNVLADVLDILAAHGVVALTIGFERRRTDSAIAIEIAREDTAIDTKLVAAIERIAAVRAVTMLPAVPHEGTGRRTRG